MWNEIRAITENIQYEFALSYANLAKHLRKNTVSMRALADYMQINYDRLQHPDHFSEKTQKKILREIKKVNIDKLVLRFISKNVVVKHK
jgi:hypothetical protein